MARLGHWGKVLVAALGVAAVGTATVAQDKVGFVKARQDFMKAQAADNKVITDYTKGAADKAAAIKAIDDLLERNGKIVGLFTPGTSSTDMPGVSNAKAVIWTDHEKFVGIVKALHDEEVKVSDVIKTGTPEAVAAARGNMGKVGCGACHEEFREKLPS
jgi:cytochrome c556